MRILCVMVLLMLAGCSTFESFHFKLPLEIAYGDTAVQSQQAVEIAEAQGRRDVMLEASKAHTVNVKLPPEMMPAVEVFEVPPDLAPGASGMATMSDGTTLYDCVEEKGESVICSRVPGQ